METTLENRSALGAIIRGERTAIPPPKTDSPRDCGATSLIHKHLDWDGDCCTQSDGGCTHETPLSSPSTSPTRATGDWSSTSPTNRQESVTATCARRCSTRRGASTPTNHHSRKTSLRRRTQLRGRSSEGAIPFRKNNSARNFMISSVRAFWKRC